MPVTLDLLLDRALDRVVVRWERPVCLPIFQVDGGLGVRITRALGEALNADPVLSYSGASRFWISSSGTPFVSGITLSTQISCSTIMLE